MERMKPALLLATISLMFSGCILHRSGIAETDFELRNGVTTRREVVAHWGNPDYVRGTEWSWKTSKAIGSKVKAAYMMVGVTIANSQRSTMEYRLTFDSKGVLEKTEMTESLPRGVSWSPFPL